MIIKGEIFGLVIWIIFDVIIDALDNFPHFINVAVPGWNNNDEIMFSIININKNPDTLYKFSIKITAISTVEKPMPIKNAIFSGFMLMAKYVNPSWIHNCRT